MDKGASVPDQALAVPVEPASGLDPTGFDPSRVIGHQSFAGNLTAEFDRACHQLRSSFLSNNAHKGGRWHLILSRDSDEHPEGEDPKGLSGEAMPARAVNDGIAQNIAQNQDVNP